MGSFTQNSLQSKADQTSQISKSVYVSNFPDGCTARDLWKACNDYGTVVDVFIPAKKSKPGKRFAFVRFIKVNNLNRLNENIKTIWFGRFHLIANHARYERQKKSFFATHKDVPGNHDNEVCFARPPRADQSSHPSLHVASGSPSFVSAVKGPMVSFSYGSSSPALVLDDSCEANRDLDNCVMGEVKRFSSINNLRVLLSNEGFNNVKLAYLGGLWVMIDLHSSQVKAKFMSHVGIASWFGKICSAQPDFVSKERIIWVDIEGVPFHAWPRESFCKIGSKLGEVIDLEETLDDYFARKHICIKTKQEDGILEGFKIIIHDESVKGRDEVNDGSCNHGNFDAASDVEEISDTVFGDTDVKNDNDRKDNFDKDSSLPYPPSFTPNSEPILFDDHKANAPSDYVDHKQSDNLSLPVMENNQVVDEYHSSDSHVLKRELNTGGSILDVLDSMINIVHTMGYNMEGCVKDMEKIIASQGVRDETKMESISDMDVKILLGNYSFEYMLSGALGNSGGILYVWDPNSFGKDRHIISDNFVAIYGTWKPTRSKILLISVYAPQSIPDKQLLWSYLSSIISQWDVDCIVMGDFNEVRYVEERMGSLFNPQGATEFNSFINNSGLIDVHLEGYSFTWAHPSTSKMSKLDQFLVTEGRLSGIQTKLRDIDVVLDLGGANDSILSERKDLLNKLNDLKSFESREYIQKAKVKWAIEGDDNSKFFHGVINRKRSNLAIKGIMVDGEWVDNPIRVKDEFHSHFATRFQAPATNRWCNSSFVALIPKINDPKIVNDYRPISLIGNIYKVVTKVLANRLSTISDIISDVQSAFLPNRQILDGPFIINELLSWCKHKKKQIMMFKVDFAKAYDSVRWDYLDDVLRCFGFGSKWRYWISGSLNLCMASILVNGSPTAEFPFHCGLKQGDPLAPFLFILIMESFHLSFMRVIKAGLFKGIQLGSSLSISHLFYADDAVFIGEWSDNNLSHIMQILYCFSLSSGLKINIMKSNFLGVGVSREAVSIAARNIGCLVTSTPFKYLGVMVGGNMYLTKSWDAILGKLKSRLSKWKQNTLSIGGRLTLLKSVLGSTHIYAMSLYKTPKSVLHSMESIRRKFFYGANDDIKKITWISWSKSFPRMYALENSKDCYVADKFNGSLLGSFRRIARGGIEEYQLSQL
nr:RNA-directed DNA polymerase, eukaryota [Tanacetum cinerariifolium]